MCGIFGVMAPNGLDADAILALHDVMTRATDRGSDSVGIGASFDDPYRGYTAHKSIDGILTLNQLVGLRGHTPTIVIGNTRAEPTTEWVKDKTEEDVHPFQGRRWAVVHNGVVANDRELAKKYRMTLPSPVDSAVLPGLFDAIGERALRGDISAAVREIRGSYALLAIDLYDKANRLIIATNYKPLYTLRSVRGDLWIASQPEYLSYIADPQPWSEPVPFPAYTVRSVANRPDLRFWESSVRDGTVMVKEKVLVICSGGLDSTVAATMAVRKHGKENVTLLHYTYACRAQEKELEAVRQVASRLGVMLRIVTVDRLFKLIASNSPLLKEEAEVKEGYKGVEFAYEWVPARNLVFLSIAIAQAENDGFTTLMLGNNLEEAGAYPDNEMEFINRMNHVMPFAIGADKNIRIEQPLGNKMKHEIVKEGLSVMAPMDATWSCYHAGFLHCGKCGPCTMRRIAFQMNDADDPIVYASD